MMMKDAITRAIAEEMRRDPKVLVLGENIHYGSPSGAKLVAPLYKEFGAGRVLETPVSENAIVGGALGLALGGMTPIAEIFSADFVFTAGNELFNDIPKWRVQHGLRQPLPLVLRGPSGTHGKGGGGPEHSQCPEAYFLHCPGINVVVPGTPADAYGLMRTAIRCGKPTIYLEHRRLYYQSGPVPDDAEYAVPLGKAEVVREGRDLTLVSWGWTREVACAAAVELAASGVQAEVIDLRSIVPMDAATVLASVAKTGRLLVVEEASVRGSVGSELLATVAEAPGTAGVQGRRLGMPHAFHPYDHALEDAMLPHPAAVVDAARDMLSNQKTPGTGDRKWATWSR